MVRYVSAEKRRMKNQKRREGEIVALRMKIERREENENKKKTKGTRKI
jgi:hypothetical protein